MIATIGASAALATKASELQAELATGAVAFEQQPSPRGFVTVAALDSLDRGLDRQQRRRALLEYALADLLARTPKLHQPVLVVVVSDTDQTADATAQDLAQLATGKLELGPMERVSHGRAGWFAALCRAEALLQDSRVEAVLVVATDSHCDLASVAALARASAILGEDNRDGLIPGEGACVALCCRADSPLAQLGGATRCEVVGVGREPAPFTGPRPNLSQGLSALFEQLGARSPGATELVVDCQTGESRFTKEFHAAYLRNGPLMPEPLVTQSTAAPFGDAGVATPGLALLIAQQFTGPHGRALIYASDDAGHLGAAIIVSPERSVLRQRLSELWSDPNQRDAAAGYRGREDSLDRHLEELGYLQLDRLDDLDSAQTPWFELFPIEARIQAHLDALALGGANTIERATLACSETAFDRSRGALLVAASWFTAPPLLEAVCRLAAQMDAVELDELAGAIELGTHPAPLVSALLAHESGDVRRCGVELAAAVTDIPEPELAALLNDETESVRGAAAIALARRGTTQRTDLLVAAATRAPETVGYVAALVWLGHAGALSRLRWLLGQSPPIAEQAARWLSIAGEPGDMRAIHERLTQLEATPTALEALGNAGLVESLPFLLDGLDHDDEPVVEAAACALDRITGAGLREDLLDEDGLLEVRRCIDPKTWRTWLDGRQWPAGRLRDGQPFSVQACWNELIAGSSERLRRRWAADELALRGGAATQVVVRWSVDRQRKALDRWGNELRRLGVL
ncbi:3-oxoacyl-(acyl-carrier-protein) synthase [Enhygromyxa salina]|uniref:3-oxoacyl-(Acyl-carrier-protein) synthase n=1 Tax=Enhygromyxa salina TaxID=215803 RepID=A0A0C2D7F9_9BACT|nr:3-oxoacyl-(acyl-carrier-protein) synthase [Enhygromyxa salina]